jgi:large subunit ribosomal protein L13e
MKHNNQIPNNHFRKHWQCRIKTWFDQAGRKKSRRLARAAKAAAVAPAPVGFLRPIVRCPTVKYNTRVRAGKGFSLGELKQAGISRKAARKVGIAVDHRRRNKSVEGLRVNEARLNFYKSKVVIHKGPAPQGFQKGSIEGAKLITKHMPAKLATVVETHGKITKEMAEFSAYHTLRKARSTAKYHGIRAKRAAEEAAKSAI